MTQAELEAAAAQRFTNVTKARLVLEILAMYVRVRRLLRRGDLPDVVAELSAGGWPGEAVALDGPAASTYGAHLGRATMRTLALLPTDSRCLVRSLVLIGLLSRRGIPASLVIGVRAGPTFGAHAWVEHGHRPLLPAGGDEYERLTALSGDGSPA